MTSKPHGHAGHGAPDPADLTEAEWEIMKVVWEKQPCAAGDVQEQLQDSRNWAYSTVKTLMDRMAGKGLLTTRNIRNLQLFSAAVTQVQARRREFRRMLNRAFDGALGPMMQFLVDSEKLSEGEIEELRKRISRSRKK
jgi:BlaI family penicillinase repressor